jgi:S1-C subfamily serine protease
MDVKSHTTEVLFRDPVMDIALLKTDGIATQWLRMGNSDKMERGDWVVVMGNPFNLEHSASFGIVSHPARNLRRFGVKNDLQYIQTDAPINPGNSGGPMISTRGKVIGVNTLGMRGADGIGFAIPINRVQEMVNGWLDSKVCLPDDPPPPSPPKNL